MSTPDVNLLENLHEVSCFTPTNWAAAINVSYSNGTIAADTEMAARNEGILALRLKANDARFFGT